MTTTGFLKLNPETPTQYLRNAVDAIWFFLYKINYCDNRPGTYLHNEIAVANELYANPKKITGLAIWKKILECPQSKDYLLKKMILSEYVPITLMGYCHRFLSIY